MILVLENKNGIGVILDENNEEIISYTPTKSFASIIVSTNKLSLSNTYTIKIDNETYETFTVSSITTIVGNTREMNVANNPGGRR